MRETDAVSKRPRIGLGIIVDTLTRALPWGAQPLINDHLSVTVNAAMHDGQPAVPSLQSIPLIAKEFLVGHAEWRDFLWPAVPVSEFLLATSDVVVAVAGESALCARGSASVRVEPGKNTAWT